MCTSVQFIAFISREDNEQPLTVSDQNVAGYVFKGQKHRHPFVIAALFFHVSCVWVRGQQHCVRASLVRSCVALKWRSCVRERFPANMAALLRGLRAGRALRGLGGGKTAVLLVSRVHNGQPVKLFLRCPLFRLFVVICRLFMRAVPKSLGAEGDHGGRSWGNIMLAVAVNAPGG